MDLEAHCFAIKRAFHEANSSVIESAALRRFSRHIAFTEPFLAAALDGLALETVRILRERQHDERVIALNDIKLGRHLPSRAFRRGSWRGRERARQKYPADNRGSRSKGCHVEPPGKWMEFFFDR
jgi:hypothetical protein